MPRRHVLPMLRRRGRASRRARWSAALTAVTAAFSLFPAAAGAASPPQISVSISGTAGANGWYRSAVTVAWSVSDPTGLSSSSGCGTTRLPNETAGTTLVCSASNNADPPLTSSVSVTIKIDVTPPEVSGANPDRAPDVNGWYNRPVAFSFVGTDALSGLDSCPGGTYGGPDAEAATVTGTCRDKAGNVGSRAFGLRYDATPPTVSAAAEREPDAGGWYNRPVTVRFSAADGASGPESCSSTAYTGPDTAGTTVGGTCRDRAGNTAAGSFALKYDATPPVLGSVAVAAGDRVNTLRWQSTSPDDTTVVTRRPSRKGGSSRVVFRGAGTSAADRTIANGIEYVYELRSYDVAGNASKPVERLVMPKVLVPRAGYAPRVTGRPLLRWSPRRGSRYYHVQLFRGRTRIFASWPKRAEFTLPASWRFAGDSHRLRPGRYRWYAWAGIGARSAARYVRVGRGEFIVAGS